ncbi:Rmf/CrpP fold protein [Streptomyces pseudogriseolus]
MHVGTREDIAKAITAGREAGQQGDHVTACPHPRTSILRRAWFRGYAETRPLADQPDGEE